MPISNYPVTTPTLPACLKVFDNTEILYVNPTGEGAAALKSGDVVSVNSGHMVGIVARDTAIGDTAVLETNGTWDMPNDTSGGITVSQGAPLIWDGTNKIVKVVPLTAGTYYVIGVAAKSYSAYKGARVRVHLLQNANNAVVVAGQ